MGNLLSSRNDKEKEKEKEKDEEIEIGNLKKKLEEQQTTINKQVMLIGLLKNKISTLEAVTNEVIIDDTKNVNELFKVVKEKKDYEYLVFSGGGIKAISHCGSLLVLDQLKVLYDNDNKSKIKGYAGTSAGSLIAAMLAIGYTPKELEKIISDLDFKKFLDDKWGYIRDAYNFLEDYGICPGTYAYKLFGTLIKNKTGNKNYTIKQLYEEKGITLVIVGTNKSTNSSVYFHPKNKEPSYSDIPIRKAMRISMGIPILFEPEECNGDKFCDGGIFDNYPIHVFDGDYPGDPNAKLNLVEPNAKVLGFNILTNSELVELTINEREEYDSVLKYLLSFIDGFLAENERRMITPSYWKRTINLITPNMALYNFDLNKSQKDELLNIGKDGVIEFFELKDFKYQN